MAPAVVLGARHRNHRRQATPGDTAKSVTAPHVTNRRLSCSFDRARTTPVRSSAGHYIDRMAHQYDFRLGVMPCAEEMADNHHDLQS